MRSIIAIIASCLFALPALAAGDATQGQHEFGRCTACHSIAPGHSGIGPSLDHIVGRQAGTQPGYSYSPAMAGAHITWTDETLDRFLANPQGVVRGTKMLVGVPNAQARQDIIAYLDTLK